MEKSKEDLLSKAPWREDEDDKLKDTKLRGNFSAGASSSKAWRGGNDEDDKFKDAKQPGSSRKMHVPGEKKNSPSDYDEDNSLGFHRNFQFLQTDTILNPLPPAMAYNASRNLSIFTGFFTQFFDPESIPNAQPQNSLGFGRKQIVMGLRYVVERCPLTSNLTSARIGGIRIPVEDDSKDVQPIAFCCNEPWSIVLVGHSGNGISATGNTILGRESFQSRHSSSSITRSFEIQTTTLESGQIINVIDTPGLFHFSSGIDSANQEIFRCISMTESGIHAVIFVFLVRSRFSKKEEATIRSLKSLFGSTISDYIIVLFTGGDELCDKGETLDDYMELIVQNLYRKFYHYARIERFCFITRLKMT